MARWLRRACRAMHRSQGVPSYSWPIVNWCPRLRRMRAQRTAVTRLPLRECGGAGQAMKILMRRLYAKAQIRNPKSEIRNRTAAAADGLQWLFCADFGFRISDFGFRISDFLCSILQ